MKKEVLYLSVGNYYGTPRPVHIGPESPPITYQEHRNLLRNFRTRSKSLSNLEKAVEEGDNSEEDSGLSGTKKQTDRCMTLDEPLNKFGLAPWGLFFQII